MVTYAVALPGISANGDEYKNKETDRGEDQALPIPEKTELRYPNLGFHLDGLVVQLEKEETTSEDATSATPVHSEESVAVAIYLTGSVADVASFLEDNGGDPRNVGEDYIEAYVPVALLGELSVQTGVLRMREIIPPESAYGPITSQGVQAHAASAWHQAGITGNGVKVGIIDTGFAGFSDLIGQELRTPVAARCYTDFGAFSASLTDCEGGVGPLPSSIHGTAVAETVIDIAPEVSLYISNPLSDGDLRSAVAWMVSEGVSVINHSVAWGFDGPGDGTSPNSHSPLNTVDLAVNGEIIWVNSAGNAAQATWFGPYSNADEDEWVDFHGMGERNYLRLPARDEIMDFAVELRWEDSWRGATTDLDIFLYDGIARELVASSRDVQSGRPSDNPHEYMTLQANPSPVPSAGRYFLAVSHEVGDAPEWIQLRVRFFGSLETPSGSGSIGNPAESKSPGMLAVGATHYWDTHTIAGYSSRGPTPDGRDKPDIVGTACAMTVTYQPRGGGRCWFGGTSQASPHVAGMAALVRQMFRNYTPQQTARFLKDNAEERGDPGLDNTWGSGFALLPPPGSVSRDLDRDALLALYNATDGPSWTNNTNWLSDRPLGEWRGVTTNADGSVTGLDLTGNQLSGRIPSSLGSLSNLKHLSLSGNELTGPVPPELGNLTNLQGLHLDDNQLTGSIPSGLGGLNNLTRLNLAENGLTGPVPQELGSLTSLEGLALGGNQLSGTIPTSTGQPRPTWRNCSSGGTN